MDIRERKLREIAEYIISNMDMADGYGLFSGKCGVSLFCFFYYRLTNDERYFDMGSELILGLYRDVRSKKKINPFLANGLAGQARCIDLLYSLDILSEDARDSFGESLYDYLNEEATKAAEQGNYDYLHGAVGILLYLNEKGCDISPALQKLFDVGHEDDSEIKWPSVLPHNGIGAHYDPTLAHGNAGILFLLVNAYEKNKTPLYKEKIKKIASFLLRNKNKQGEAERDQGRILEWCSGDLGIACVLLEASDSTHDDELKSAAIDMLHDCSRIRLSVQPEMPDACFCHGPAGISHIFRKLYIKYGNVEFENASLYWYDRILQYAMHDDGAAGFKAYKGNYCFRSVSLLDGLAGIGLSMIASLSDEEPLWDKFFMLSAGAWA